MSENFCQQKIEGIFNARNSYISSDETPINAMQERHFQDRFSVNGWTGMLSNNLIGPYILLLHLTADAYLEFLMMDT